jgi:hypothetical protein
VEAVAKLFIIGGLFAVAIGGMLWVGARLGLGKLPGDIVIKGDNFIFVAPIVTGIILSIVLTVALNVGLRLWR